MFSTKDKLLSHAAQISQINRELYAIGKDAKDVSLAASHEIGIVCAYLTSISERLIKVAGKI